MGKKGASEVVATLLLIMIAVMIISIVIYFVFDYLNKREEDIGVANDLNNEDLGIENVDFSTPNSFIVTLKKGPGDQVELTRTGGGVANAQGIVLVSDVSGSMEWCEDIRETDYRVSLWNYSGNYFCSERRINISECPAGTKKKIMSLNESTNVFIDAVKGYPSTYLGIVEYSSNSLVNQVKLSDLSIALYLNVSLSKNPNGPAGVPISPGAWQKRDFDDSTWGGFTPWFGRIPGDHNREMIFLRKKFTLSDNQYDTVKTLNISLANREGVVCFLNEKEILYTTSASWSESSGPTWTYEKSIPIKALVPGENILACQLPVTHNSDNTRHPVFNLNMTANNGIKTYSLTDGPAGSWKILPVGEGNTDIPYGVISTDPKYIKIIRRNTQTNITLYATIFNTGMPVNKSFKVGFYKTSVSPANRLGEINIDSITSRELKEVKFSLNDSVTNYLESYIAVVDDSNVISEFDETNNLDSRNVYTYDPRPDLYVKVNDDAYNTCSPGLQTFDVEFEVGNGGLEDCVLASQSFNLSVFDRNTGLTLNSRMVNGPMCPGWGNHQYITMPITAQVPSGPPGTRFTYYAWVDYDINNYNGVIDETVENHNGQAWWYQNHYFTLRRPDLYVQSMDVVSRVCSLTDTKDVRLTVYNDYCPIFQPTDVAVSISPETWNAPLGSKQTILASASAPFLPDTARTFTFTIPNNLTEIASLEQPFKFYAGVDTIMAIEEDSESNNNVSNTSTTGTNLRVLEFNVNPTNAQSGNPTTFSATVKFDNENNCPTGPFNITMYKNDGGYQEICRVPDLIWSPGTYFRTCPWTTSLSENTQVYAELDSDNALKEYNETDNKRSALITVSGIISSLTPFSVLPLQGLTGLKNIFLAILDSRIDYCDGTQQNLFTSPDTSLPTSLPRVQPLRDLSSTVNVKEIVDFMSGSETWWDTCICCGINKAKTMLTDPLNNPSLFNKYMILMSDGNATTTCVSTNATDDARDAAADAAKAGIIIYTIGFGNKSEIDNRTLLNISQDVNMVDDPEDRYFYVEDADDLAAVYEQIAGSIKVTYGAVVTYDYIKVIVYAHGKSFNTTISSDRVPAPLAEARVTVPIESSWGITQEDITRIELWPVVITESGKEVTSSEPMSVWVRPSEY